MKRFILGVALAALSVSALAEKSNSASQMGAIKVKISGYITASPPDMSEETCGSMEDRWDSGSLSLFMPSCGDSLPEYELQVMEGGTYYPVSKHGLSVELTHNNGDKQVVSVIPEVIVAEGGSKIVFPEALRQHLGSLKVLSEVDKVYF
jgi:hypothetical protein